MKTSIKYRCSLTPDKSSSNFKSLKSRADMYGDEEMLILSV